MRIPGSNSDVLHASLQLFFYSFEAVIRVYFQSKINVTAVDAKVTVAVKSALRKMDGPLDICVMMI